MTIPLHTEFAIAKINRGIVPAFSHWLAFPETTLFESWAKGIHNRPALETERKLLDKGIVVHSADPGLPNKPPSKPFVKYQGQWAKVLMIDAETVTLETATGMAVVNRSEVEKRC